MADQASASSQVVKYHTVKGELQNKDHQDGLDIFLRSVAISKLTEKGRVQSTLSQSNLPADEVDKLANYVVKLAPRLFLLLIHIERLNFIPFFLAKEFTDNDLPICESESSIDSRPPQELCGTDQLDIRFNLARPSGSFPWDHLKDKGLDDFIRDQWAFLDHVFPAGEFSTYNFHPKRRLPYTHPLKPIVHDGSFFSVVRKAILHGYDGSSWHQQYLGGSVHHFDGSETFGTSEGMEVAIKELSVKGTDSGVEVDTFYKREVDTLKQMATMAQQGEEHLIRAIAAYGRESKRFFVFPWAKGGDLEQFWKLFGQRKGAQTRELMAWSLKQMIGIAGGLAKLHGKQIRHGDIKPQNILHFTTDPEKVSGNLVISDVGLAKFHEAYTKDRNTYTKTMRFTVDYQPPEPKELVRSRLYDYWSLGCVFLEFLIWMCEGYDGLGLFRTSLNDKDNPKRFWAHGPEDRPIVHPVVASKMEDLQKVKFASGLVDLIKTELLETNTTRTYTDENARIVLESLQATEQQFLSRTRQNTPGETTPTPQHLHGKPQDPTTQPPKDVSDQVRTIP